MARPADSAGRAASTGTGRGDAGDTTDRGMVTAELALALPALVLVLAALTTVTGAMSALAKASDAARSGARAASIGVGSAEVIEDAARLAPHGSQIAVSADGAADGWVAVTVTPPAVHLGPFRLALPPVTGRAPLETDVTGVGP